MKIAICDDETIQREGVVNYLAVYKEKYNLKIFEFCCGEELVEKHRQGYRYDVIFLDIKMGGLNGLETGRIIRSMNKSVIISFITNYKQYVFHSFKIEPFDYLVKPVQKKEFEALFERIIKKYQDEHFMVSIKWKSKVFNIEVKKIIVIEGYHRQVMYKTVKDEFRTVGKLDDHEKMLQGYNFMRCHQGFLVNMKHIESIEEKFIRMANNLNIEMSIRKKRQCLKVYNDYLSRYYI